MRDDVGRAPDHRCLFETASGQRGYFTTEQARACGFGWDDLAYHARTGRFLRLRRGLYRLRDYPSSPHEEAVAALLAVGDSTVVSHESALDLLGLSDVIPDGIHLTVPRTRRHLPRLPGVIVHTASEPPLAEETVSREGVRLTDATRSIIDAAAIGTAPEQIEAAVRQAVVRGLTTRQRLETAAAKRGRRVRRLIEAALREARE